MGSEANKIPQLKRPLEAHEERGVDSRSTFDFSFKDNFFLVVIYLRSVEVPSIETNVNLPWTNKKFYCKREP